MEKFIVKKSTLSGEIAIPPSKSQTLHAILFGALGKGKTTIQHPLISNDSKAMISACTLLGAKIQHTSAGLEIEGTGGEIDFAENVIDAGNSGIVLRFCAATGALGRHPIVITGDHSIRYRRPMKSLLQGLRQLGVKADSMRGDEHAPIILHGPLLHGEATIDGSDSQPVSALLIAGAFAQGQIDLHVQNAGEKPWVALTLDWFSRLGIPYENKDFRLYRLYGHTIYRGFDYTVPGDFGSAAFPIAAALITQSELTLNNIDMEDNQGDKELIDILIQMGALIEIDPIKKALHVRKTEKLFGIAVDINRYIDAITILAVVACYAGGETFIYNGAIARQRECDKIHCIAKELRKMGADIEETEDGLRIRCSKLHGAAVESHDDHRMAMALAVAAMGCDGETTISSVGCVAKTFPTFLKDFQQLGAQISEI